MGVIIVVEGIPECCTGEAEGEGAVHALFGVVGGGVRDFVAEDGGEHGVAVFSAADNAEDAGVDAHLAARQGEGVGGVVFEDNEFPLGSGHIDDALEALGNALYGDGVMWVRTDFVALLEFLELADAVAADYFVSRAGGDVSLGID